MVDQRHPADADGGELDRHLPPHRPHADDDGVGAGQRFWRNQLALADVTVAQVGSGGSQRGRVEGGDALTHLAR